MTNPSVPSSKPLVKRLGVCLMDMKFLILSLLMFSSLGLISHQAFAFEYIQDERIEWVEGIQLSWSDFKGEVGVVPDNYSRSYESGAYITTWVEANWSWNQFSVSPCEYEIKKINSSAYFLPYSSWFKPDGIGISDYSLHHELGHFHIAKYHANEFQKLEGQRFACPNGIYDISEIEKNIHRMFDEQIVKVNEMDSLYDFETKGSGNITKQNEWNQKINDMLSRHHENFPGYYFVEETCCNGSDFDTPKDVEEKIDKIPEWVRNIFIWYGEKSISEDEVLNAIKFLINQGIIDLNY